MIAAMAEGKVARVVRERAPLFAAFFARPTDAFDTGLFLVLVGAGGSASTSGTFLMGAEVALFAGGIAVVARTVTRRALDACAFALGAALVLVALGVDRFYSAFFHEHVTLAVAREALDAVRTHAVPVNYGALGAIALTALLLFVVLASILKGLSFLPRSPRQTDAARRAAIPSLLVVGILVSVRGCLAAPTTTATPTADASDRARIAALFGAKRAFDEVEAARATFAAHPPHARSRPDILIVHVESLRADMLREDVAPHMFAFARECLYAPMHFTTGTNTGTGVFGLLDGLTSPLYPLARAAHAHPVPLEVLRALGYDLSVFFISNFGTYDGLYDLYFQDLASYRYAGPEEPVWDADGKMVDAWIARLRTATRDTPRFDYVVLDSTHYDYSYPPEFEKFTPAMTLDLGVRDMVVKQEGINDKLKWRAPFVRNRYQNSILYADSLVAKILDALRATKRLDDTIVIVTGDHGEAFWEHGVFGHGFFSLANEQTQVPFLMRLPPAIAKANSRYRYSSHADAFPTIFDAMGLEGAPPFMNGKSLLAYDASLDLAVVGFGVTGDHTDRRYAVVGDGLKVSWTNAPPFDVTDVTTDADEPIAPLPATRVDDLVVRAIASEVLR
jgi:hypothetical protein